MVAPGVTCAVNPNLVRAQHPVAVLKALVKAGCNPRLKANDGKTAYDLDKWKFESNWRPDDGTLKDYITPRKKTAKAAMEYLAQFRR